jgi:hypothetical protein
MIIDPIDSSAMWKENLIEKHLESNHPSRRSSFVKAKSVSGIDDIEIGEKCNSKVFVKYAKQSSERHLKTISSRRDSKRKDYKRSGSGASCTSLDSALCEASSCNDTAPTRPQRRPSISDEKKEHQENIRRFTRQSSRKSIVREKSRHDFGIRAYSWDGSDLVSHRASNHSYTSIAYNSKNGNDDDDSNGSFAEDCIMPKTLTITKNFEFDRSRSEARLGDSTNTFGSWYDVEECNDDTNDISESINEALVVLSEKISSTTSNNPNNSEKSLCRREIKVQKAIEEAMTRTIDFTSQEVKVVSTLNESWIRCGTAEKTKVSRARRNFDCYQSRSCPDFNIEDSIDASTVEKNGGNSKYEKVLSRTSRRTFQKVCGNLCFQVIGCILVLYLVINTDNSFFQLLMKRPIHPS